MASEGKKNKKYGNTVRRVSPAGTRITALLLYAYSEAATNRQMRREIAHKTHTRAWAVKKLGYEPGDWDTSTSCREMRKIVRMSSNRKIGKSK